MIILINNQGQVVSQQADKYFQGSSKANIINVIAPFASNIMFKANFKLPNGEYYPVDKTGYVFRPSIQVNEKLNLWYLEIDFPITQYYGNVEMQLRAISGDQTICTSIIKLPVQKGVPYEQEYVESTTYDEILKIISDMRALLNNKVDIKKSYYQQAENITEETTGTYYILSAKDNEYQEVTLPQDYAAGQNYFTKTAIVELLTSYTQDYNEGVKVIYNNLLASKKFELLMSPQGIYYNGNKIIDSKALNEELATINSRIDSIEKTTNTLVDLLQEKLTPFLQKLIDSKQDKHLGEYYKKQLLYVDEKGDLTTSKEFTVDNLAKTLDIDMDNQTYILTLKLKGANGEILSEKAIDLPIESMVVDATYVDGILTLTLQSGKMIDIPISATLDGLVPETRTINGHPLTDNITLKLSDIENDVGYVDRKEAGKCVILSANGTETEVYDFVVEDADHYTQYRENGVEFLVDLHLPLVGELTATKPVVITFGDTVYYLHIGASGENLTMGDLQGYQTYNSATGYRYLFKAVFSTGEIAGFVLVDGSWATKTDIDELKEMISKVDVAVDNTTIVKNTENQLSVATDIMDAITTEWGV